MATMAMTTIIHKEHQERILFQKTFEALNVPLTNYYDNRYYGPNYETFTVPVNISTCCKFDIFNERQLATIFENPMSRATIVGNARMGWIFNNKKWKSILEQFAPKLLMSREMSQEYISELVYCCKNVMMIDSLVDAGTKEIEYQVSAKNNRKECLMDSLIDENRISAFISAGSAIGRQYYKIHDMLLKYLKFVDNNQFKSEIIDNIEWGFNWCLSTSDIRIIKIVNTDNIIRDESSFFTYELIKNTLNDIKLIDELRATFFKRSLHELVKYHQRPPVHSDLCLLGIL